MERASQFKSFTNKRIFKLASQRIKRGGAKLTYASKKLVLNSNSQGNSFILSHYQIQEFAATNEFKQQVKIFVKELNQLMYDIWSKGKQFHKQQCFSIHFKVLKILFLMVLIGVVLGLLFPFNYFDKILIIGFYLILISTVGTVIASNLLQFKDYNYENQVMKQVKLFLKQYNENKFQKLGFFIRCDKQLTWISLNKDTRNQRSSFYSFDNDNKNFLLSSQGLAKNGFARKSFSVGNNDFCSSLNSNVRENLKRKNVISFENDFKEQIQIQD